MFESNDEKEMLEDIVEQQAEQDVVSDVEDSTPDEQAEEELLEEAPLDHAEPAGNDAQDDADTDVDIDQVADTAIEVLQTILKPFDIGDITIDEYDGDEGELILDITGEGYKSRQRQKIESIAKSAANRAASQGREVSMRPMTPYERRIVHIVLRDDSRVETESTGEGSGRHVVVIPV